MIQNITPAQAIEIINQGDVDVIDVRESHEWVAGHLAKSRHVPLGQLRASPKASIPSDNVIFVCAAGVRSETAARLAVGLGLKKVYNLRGGTRAWSGAGLPLVKDESGYDVQAVAAAG